MHLRNSSVVSALLSLLLTVHFAVGSPINDAGHGERDNPPDRCETVKDVGDPVEVNEPSAFCSSFLRIPSLTSVVDRTVASQSTTTTTTLVTDTRTRTSYVFLPGNPPTSTPQRRRKDKRASKPEPAPAPAAESPDELPAHSTASSMISGACSSCLGLAATHTVSTVSVSAPAAAVTTKTVYPCATADAEQQQQPQPALPSPGPAYGLSNYLSAPDSAPPGLANGTSNQLFYLDTAPGGSAVACCHACYFELEYCVQAFYYAYQGCVVMQAADFSGPATTATVATTCPRGTLPGLLYRPDNAGPFRSTGDIAGPCGERYTNF